MENDDDLAWAAAAAFTLVMQIEHADRRREALRRLRREALRPKLPRLLHPPLPRGE